MSGEVLSLESIVVKGDRVEAEVVVAEQAYRYTTPQLAERILARFPQLLLHTCKNEKGHTFASAIEHTSLPHVLEHLIIELQVQAAAGISPDSTSSPGNSPASTSLTTQAEGISPCTTYVGNTQWICRDEGRARVAVSFTDDLVALRAFRDAANFLNQTVIQ